MSGFEERIMELIRQLREEIRMNDQRIKQLSGGSGGGVDLTALMLKAIYDQDEDGVVDNSKRLDGYTLEEILSQGGGGSGSGDMQKSVYDTNNNGIVDNSERLDGHPASDFALKDHILVGHKDLIVTNPQEADVLVYDTDAEKWKNAFGQAAGLIDSITYLQGKGGSCTQGVCADADYIFVTDNDYIRKYRKSDNKWMGALQVSNKVSGYTHAGDCCYHDGVIYIAMSNYPTQPYIGCIIKVSADLTYLGYIPLYGNHEASSVCRKSDGTFWVTSYSYLNPCKIFKYSSDWEYLGSYDLEKVDSNGQWGYDGIEWRGNYLYANVHDYADMGDYLDVYYFDGESFSRVQRISHVINGYICHQGIAFDPAESDVLWMVNRPGSVAYKTSLTFGAAARLGNIYFKGTKVGIGISTPAETLHVNGRIRVESPPSADMDVATKKYVDDNVGGGASSFDDLTDTPASKSGASKKLLAVSVDESAIEYINNPELLTLLVNGLITALKTTTGHFEAITIKHTGGWDNCQSYLSFRDGSNVCGGFGMDFVNPVARFVWHSQYNNGYKGTTDITMVLYPDRLVIYNGYIEAKELSSSPDTPPSGYGRIYVKSDGKLYFKNDDGTEYDLTSGGGGGGASSFLELTDTPSSYSGAGGKVVKVKTDESGLEFDEASAPGAHHTTHEAGGSDEIKLDDLASPDDNTDLNVSTSAHGLCPKLPNDPTQFLSGVGTWLVPAAGRSIIIDENFDGLDTGNIEGQGDYAYASAWDDVENSGYANVVVKSGSDKNLEIACPANTTQNIKTLFSNKFGLTPGCRVSWKMKSTVDTVNNSGGVLISDVGGTTKASVRFGYNNGWKLRFYNGSALSDIMSAQKDTWYQVDMLFFPGGSGIGFTQVYIDGVYKGTYNSTSISGGIKELRAYWTAGASASALYVDDLFVEVYHPLEAA